MSTDILTVVKLLADGRPLEFAAQATGLKITQVREIATLYGWPTEHRLRAAVDALTKQATDPIPARANKQQAFAASRPAPAPKPSPSVAPRLEQSPPEPTKRCAKCHLDRPLRHFYAHPRTKDRLRGACKECDNAAPSQKRLRPYTDTKAVKNRARSRAAARVVEAHHDDFLRFYEEELAKARAELEALKDAAAKPPARPAPKDQAPTAAPTHEHTPPPTPLLKPGPRATYQDSTVDRLREDVGRCPHCITSHDRGHACSACGAQPTVTEPGRPISA